MSLLVPFLCTLLLLGAQAQVYFNNSYNCTEGCYINNPAIYIGGLSPTPTDAVFFNITDPTTYLIAPANYTYNVTEFHVWNASLTIEANATITVAHEIYMNNIMLVISENGSLVGHAIEDEEDAETEAEFEAVVLNSHGRVGLFQASFHLSFIIGHNTSRFHFSEFEIENGTIEILQGAEFQVHDESEFSFSTIYFENTPFLGDVEFESVTANFPNGFYAENQYVISSSNFSAYFPDALSNVSFILAGKNNLNVSNLNFNSDKIKINNTGTPFITFNVNNNATFDGNLTVPGEIVINSGAQVTFNGTINLSGGLNADVDSTTQVRATGSLFVGRDISFIGHNENNSFVVNNANITASSINLNTFQLRSYSGTTILNGNVTNNGSIHIFESSSVIVHGNYIQVANASFGAFDLDNSNDRPINLVVNGHASIDGAIKFNTSETEKSFVVTVIHATNGLSGNFTTSHFEGDALQFKPQLIVNSSSVQISINPPAKPWHKQPWWVWLLVGVAAFTVLVLIVIIVRVVRNRARYEVVRS
jgi:hypothetical protein